MWRLFLIVCLLGALPWQWAEAATSGVEPAETRRVALVIGNASYAHAPLANPANDARAMGGTLRSLGFEVMEYTNATRQEMQEAIREFTQRLDAGGVGLFYFAGHGFRVANRTVLQPVDVDGRFPARLIADGVDVENVLADMSAPRPGKLNLVILDTCLNNPFRRGDQRSDHPDNPMASGLPEQTLVAYATAPGYPAADGARHGLYTATLLRAMAEPGRDVLDMFRRVQSAVSSASGQAQNPALSSSLSSGFRLLESGQTPVLPNLVAMAGDESEAGTASRGILPQNSAEQYELAFWDSIKDSNFASDYDAYLQAYPKGRFAALAKARLERLRAAATPAPPAAPAAKAAPERVPAPATPAAPERARPAPAATARTAPAPAQPADAVPPPKKPSTDATEIGEVKDCPTCPVLITLPRGTFTMGSNSDDPSEKPAHQVSIGEPFAIGKYEVTVEQWNACVTANGCPRIASIASVDGNIPAFDISWDDAQRYVQWLSKLSGKPYRLPTEAEWEYAARGGTATRHWWGEQMRPGNASCKGCGDPWQQDMPVKVGSFAANAYGLHDVNGSVWEWVGDCWHNSYRGAPTDGRIWNEPNCRDRVIRGGSWRDGSTYMLSATRFKYGASVRVSQNGFRVARDLK